MFDEMVNLYSKTLSASIKSSSLSERRARITIDIEWRSGSPKKELAVRLTDDTDLFFLYELTITEEDFQCLKSEQNLLVDFAAFPQMLIDLIELCLQEEYKDKPKNLLEFDISNRNFGSLNIKELHPLRYLTHLCLIFVQGSDIQVKNYLLSTWKALKNENEKLKNELKTTEVNLKQRLYHSQECLQAKSTELEHSKSESKGQISSITSRLTQELALEREQHLKIQTDLRLQHEREIQEHELRYVKSIQQLNEKVSCLEAQVKELSDKNYYLDSSGRDLRNRLAATEDESVFLKQEIKNVRHENTVLDGQIHEKEKVLNSLRTKIDVLEQKLKDKEDGHKKHLHVIKTLQEEKEKLEVLCEQRQGIITKRENSLKESFEETHKANHVIRKLQDKIQADYEKLETRGQIAVEQEKLIGEKEEMISKLESELSTTKLNLKTRDDEFKKLQENLETTTTKLDEYQKLLKTNENVISWLNKQLNERHLLQQKGIGVLQQISKPMHISPISNVTKVPGQPTAMSTPQNFGYYVPSMQFNSNSESAQISGKINKENNPPIDAKYFQPSVQTSAESIKPQLKQSKVNVKSKSTVPSKTKNPTVQISTSRIPKADILVPSSTTVKQPLYSAYFPKSLT